MFFWGVVVVVEGYLDRGRVGRNRERCRSREVEKK